jgi:2-C-methyl-D-erythritol 4-phosphate cytidylyltransferase
VTAAIVVLAGGVGARVGAGVNKTLLSIGGIPVIAQSVRVALDARPGRVVVVVRPDERDLMSRAIQPVLGSDGTQEVWLVDGGIERHDSEWNALTALRPLIESGEIDVVVMHDAARPLAPVGLYRRVIEAARIHGGAIPTVRVDHIVGTDQKGLVAVQTPQAFRAGDLLDAYRKADEAGFRGTDTASCVERFTDLTIVGVPSSTANLKVTYPEDLAVAEELLLRS